MELTRHAGFTGNPINIYCEELTQSVGQANLSLLWSHNSWLHMFAIRLPFLTERYLHKISDSDQRSMNYRESFSFLRINLPLWFHPHLVFVHSHVIGLRLYPYPQSMVSDRKVSSYFASFTFRVLKKKKRIYARWTIMVSIGMELYSSFIVSVSDPAIAHHLLVSIESGWRALLLRQVERLFSSRDTQ